MFLCSLLLYLFEISLNLHIILEGFSNVHVNMFGELFFVVFFLFEFIFLLFMKVIALQKLNCLVQYFSKLLESFLVV